MTRAAPLLLLLLAGCATGPDNAPSLARRPVEKLGFAEPDAPAPAPAQPDPALDRQVAALRDRVAAVGKGFDGDAGAAGRAGALATGKPAGSEAWIAAQTALAGLDDWRTQASAIVSDAQQLALDRAATLAPAYPPLTDVTAAAQAEADRESAAIAALSGRLAPG